MKSILTLAFVLFIGLAAQAQSSTKDVKVTVVEMGIVTGTPAKKARLKTKTDVARLRRFKSSKIKKALFFITKGSKAKLA